MEEEKNLTCSLCHDVYRTPKNLPCLHSFCFECLEKLIEQACSATICPICRSPFDIPQNGVQEFTTNVLLENLLQSTASVNEANGVKLCELCDEEKNAIAYCLQCEQYFCESCQKTHKRAKRTANDEFISLDEVPQKKITSKVVYCQKHIQKEMELYCNDCLEPICALCVSDHTSHSICPLVDVIGNVKEGIQDLYSQVILFFFFTFIIFFLFFFLVFF